MEVKGRLQAVAARRAARAAVSIGTLMLGAAAAGAQAGAHSSAARLPAARAQEGGGSRPAGTLFIVGGGPRSDALVHHFVQLGGGIGRARIVVLPMASEEAASSGDETVAELRGAGAAAVSCILTRQGADADSAVRRIDSATGVWFPGGDQARLMGVLRGTRVAAAIRRRYEAGAVIGGTSAGAAVMSTPMITGDERHPGGLRPPDDSTTAFITIARDNVVTTDGLGFVTDAIVDQHFVRRRRHNRLLSLVLEGPVHLGVGIDESTALLVHPDGHWSVEGESVAVVYDARHADITATGQTLGARNVSIDVLPAGSRYDPRTAQATLPREAAGRD